MPMTSTNVSMVGTGLNVFDSSLGDLKKFELLNSALPTDKVPKEDNKGAHHRRQKTTSSADFVFTPTHQPPDISVIKHDSGPQSLSAHSLERQSFERSLHRH